MHKLYSMYTAVLYVKAPEKGRGGRRGPRTSYQVFKQPLASSLGKALVKMVQIVGNVHRVHPQSKVIDSVALPCQCFA